MNKQIACPVCEGRGYVAWSNKTEDTCSAGVQMCPHCEGIGLRMVDMTNADMVRQMNDKAMAGFMATKLTDLYSIQMADEGRPPTATYIRLMKETWFRVLMQWLQQPVEDV
jgi:hypothetical protein